MEKELRQHKGIDSAHIWSSDEANAIVHSLRRCSKCVRFQCLRVFHSSFIILDTSLGALDQGDCQE